MVSYFDKMHLLVLVLVVVVVVVVNQPGSNFHYLLPLLTTRGE
jgi:hypothetical protein